MTGYRRAIFEGGYYFFTVVTHKRWKIFHNEKTKHLLKSAFHHAKQKHPFETIAMCLLPDHLHCIWKLPEGDADFSIRWSTIKSTFTTLYLSENSKESPVSASRKSKRERGVWQRRFWEHQIRDETDLHRHVNYIHYNPLKHGLVKTLDDWPWSTYHKFVHEGFYGKANWDTIVQTIDGITAGE